MGNLSENELSTLTSAFFILGVLYKTKLEKKHGAKKLTDAEIDQIELELALHVAQLPNEVQVLFYRLKVNNDMGLVTDIYSWPDVA